MRIHAITASMQFVLVAVIIGVCSAQSPEPSNFTQQAKLIIKATSQTTELAQNIKSCINKCHKLTEQAGNCNTELRQIDSFQSRNQASSLDLGEVEKLIQSKQRELSLSSEVNARIKLQFEILQLENQKLKLQSDNLRWKIEEQNQIISNLSASRGAALQQARQCKKLLEESQQKTCPTCPACRDSPACPTCQDCPACPACQICHACPACPSCPVCPVPDPCPQCPICNYEAAENEKKSAVSKLQACERQYKNASEQLSSHRKQQSEFYKLAAQSTSKIAETIQELATRTSAANLASLVPILPSPPASNSTFEQQLAYNQETTAKLASSVSSLITSVQETSAKRQDCMKNFASAVSTLKSCNEDLKKFSKRK